MQSAAPNLWATITDQTLIYVTGLTFLYMLNRNKIFPHWPRPSLSSYPWQYPGTPFSHLQDTCTQDRYVLSKLGLLGPCCTLFLCSSWSVVFLLCFPVYILVLLPPYISVLAYPWPTGTPGLCLTLHRARPDTWPALFTNTPHVFYRYALLWWPKLWLDPETRWGSPEKPRPLLPWFSRNTVHGFVGVRRCKSQEHWVWEQCLQHQAQLV